MDAACGFYNPSDNLEAATVRATSGILARFNQATIDAPHPLSPAEAPGLGRLIRSTHAHQVSSKQLKSKQVNFTKVIRTTALASH